MSVRGGEARLALIIVAIDSLSDIDALRALSSAYAEARLIVLVGAEAPNKLLKEACLITQSVLDHDIAPETLVGALDVVMSGATVQSAGLCTKRMEAPSPDEQSAGPKEDGASAVVSHRLSNRELDVLRCLADGASNKLIAIKHDEPPRVSWRLLILRGWSHDEANPTFSP